MFLLLLCFSLSSCSSIESLIRSSLEDKPIWVYEPNVNRDQIAFVGTGEAPSKALAELKSYESILQQISRYIGKDVSKEFITELSERESIERYQLKITRVFIKEGDSSQVIHHLAVAEKALIDNDRSELLVEIEEKTNKIKELQNEASSLLRKDQDVDSAIKYLEIAELASSIINETGLQFYKDAVKRFFTVIEKMTINYLSQESTSTSFLFQAKRGTRSLSTKIVQVPLQVSFIAENARQEVYIDTKTIFTDSDGKASFVNTNPSMLTRGELSIQLDISPFSPYLEYLDDLEKARLNEFVINSTIKVPYNRPTSITQPRVLLSIGEYSLKGELLESSYTEDVLSASLQKRGIKTEPIDISLEDDEEFFNTLITTYKNGPLIFGKSGITTITQVRDGYAVTVLGEISLYELPSVESDKSTDQVKAVGMGDSIEEATKQAFSQFGTISYSLLHRLLYLEP